jgi:RimJ/RimL family protein N-acetyltransferase
VLYNHDPDNHASAKVAESVGLHELGRYHVVVTDRRVGADYSEDDTAAERNPSPST